MSQSARPKGVKLPRIVEVLVDALDLKGSKKVRLECGHIVWCHAGAVNRARCRACQYPRIGHEERPTP